MEKNCLLNAKAVDAPKAAKAAAALYNAQAAGNLFRETKRKSLLEESRSLILNWPKNFARRARTFLVHLTPSFTAFHVPYIVAS
jgi:hypothetical protein